MNMSCGITLAAGLLILAGCGAGRTVAGVAGSTPRIEAFAVGAPVSSRRVEVMGTPGTAELRVDDPARPASPPLFVTLGHAVAREPRDVCFGTYVANESPEDGDVFCQIRGNEPLVLTLGYAFIPYSDPVLRFTTVWGEVNSDVDRVELIGAGATRVRLPLSADRMFLAAFSPSARGAVRLVAQLADGSSFTHTFTLPLTHSEAGAWPRLRRRGAVSNAGIGENIVTKSYRQIIEKFGPPLSTFSRPHSVRCIYYDVVGYEHGWTFCFRGQTMVGAAGNQAPPPGVH
jgi:hypothetical protein